jgi:isoquinoline 1-oxidoreductase subunit alpha
VFLKLKPWAHMAEITFRVNGSEKKVGVLPETPLLWVLRDTLNLTGTKFGCGAGLCGACTVHLDGNAVRSCSIPVSQVDGKSVTTIEGLAASAGLGADQLHILQAAWIAEEVPQCGYCQTGQIMQAAALLATTPHPTDDEITKTMNGNLCRCGTYERIRKAIHWAADGAKARKEIAELRPELGDGGAR